jgi:signal transduction histidine kinase
MRKESSCINTRAILDYVIAHAGVDPREIILGLSPEIDCLLDAEAFLRSPNNWVDAAFVAGLLARVRELTHNEDVAFEIGRFAVERALTNKRQRLLLKLFGYHAKALVNAQRLNDRWNRNKRIELVHLGARQAVVRLYWHPIPALTRDICLHLQGVATYLPLFWGDKPLQLEERCCHFAGAPYCEYRLRWQGTGSLWRVMRRLWEAPGLRREILRQMETDRRRIDLKYEEVFRLNMELNSKLRQIDLVQQCSRAVLSVLNLEQLLDQIAHLLEQACQVKHFAIFRVSDDRTSLQGLYGRAFMGMHRGQIESLELPIEKMGSAMTRAVQSGAGETEEGVDGGGEEALAGWVHAVPLIARGRVSGVLAVWGRETGRRRVDLQELLYLFSPLFAVTLENAWTHRQMREQLVQLQESKQLLCRADKLSSLGYLASQLAHEIKNPMTAIDTFFQLLPERWSDAEFRTNFFDIAQSESLRIRRLLKQLLELSAQGEAVAETSDLHLVIDGLSKLLQPQAIQAGVRLEIRATATHTRFRMVADKVRQALLNILMNALAAAPEGSTIVVATSDANGKNERPAVCIEILDEGPGIPLELREKVFEPNFSRNTKGAKASGTGLGLFIARQNIKDHGGEIGVFGREGGGALFRVLLPVERRQA